MSKREPISATPSDDAARLKALFKDKAKLTQSEFGARYGIGSQGMVWQYLNGTRPLNVSAAKNFANGLGVSIDDFSPSIAEIINEAGQRTASSEPWPFSKVDERKLRHLNKTEAAQIEGAILLIAAQLGIDIRQ